jgi:hypothetical protein
VKGSSYSLLMKQYRYSINRDSIYRYLLTNLNSESSIAIYEVIIDRLENEFPFLCENILFNDL